jgi:hypothetical protein
MAYDLEAKTFNDLARRDASVTTCILILLCLPKLPTNWLTGDEDQLILKHCCYWTTINGTPTVNSSTKRIWIPRSNTLTASSINSILRAERAKRAGV